MEQKTNFKILLSLFVLTSVAAASLVGCGPTFKFQNADNDEVTAADLALPQGRISGAEGSLDWLDIPTLSNQDKEYSFEMKISYGRVYKAGSKLVKWLTPYTCQFVPGIEKSSVSSYNSGEIPCGRIIDGNWKQLLTLPIDAYYQNASSYEVFIAGTNVPVLISRAARQGQYTENSLDNRGNVSLTSSANFGDDISLKYTPSGNSVRLEMCLNVPGGTITSTPQNVWAKAWTRELGFKVSHDSNFTVTPGAASFDYGRGCFAGSFNGNNYTVQLESTVNPYASNVQYSGLHIKIQDWFLRIADNIVGAFRTSIRASVVKQVTSTINKIADSDVETGKWFTTLHADRVLDDTSRKINRGISEGFARLSVPSSQEDVKNILRDNCRLKKFGVEESWTPRFETFCNQVIDRVSWKIEIFAVDADSASKGCYDHFARLHDSTGKWWASECYFKSKFSITLPKDFEDYGTELKSLLASHISSKKFPVEWQNLAAQYDIDPYVFLLVLQRLEAQGINKIVAGDWQSLIPQIANEIKTSFMY